VPSCTGSAVFFSQLSLVKTYNPDFVIRSHRHSKTTEVSFVRETAEATYAEYNHQKARVY
jgi:hypothetical protein